MTGGNPTGPSISLAGEFASCFTEKLETKRALFNFPPQIYQPTCVCIQTSSFLPIINNEVSLFLSQSNPFTCALNPIPPHLENRVAGCGSRKHALSVLFHPIFTLCWIVTVNIQTCYNLLKIKKKKILAYIPSNFCLIILFDFTAKYLKSFTVAVSTSQPHPVSCTQPTPDGSLCPTETVLVHVTSDLNIAKSWLHLSTQHSQ